MFKNGILKSILEFQLNQAKINEAQRRLNDAQRAAIEALQETSDVQQKAIESLMMTNQELLTANDLLAVRLNVPRETG